MSHDLVVCEEGQHACRSHTAEACHLSGSEGECMVSMSFLQIFNEKANAVCCDAVLTPQPAVWAPHHLPPPCMPVPHMCLRCQVQDLLHPSSDDLPLRMDQNKRIIIPGLSEQVARVSPQ